MIHILVSEKGGILGLDRLVEVKNRELTITERGSTRTRWLSKSQALKLQSLAEDLAQAEPQIVRYKSRPGSDSMLLSIEFRDNRGSRKLQLASEDEIPDAVWDFVNVVDEAAEAPQETVLSRRYRSS